MLVNLYFRFLTHLTLKQGQGSQTWCQSVNLKQGYTDTISERPCLNSIQEKDKKNLNAFVKS